MTFSGPLARFLPPVPDTASRLLITDSTPRGSWLLDPFGSSPRIPVDLARAGFRVLVAAGNPVNRFLLDLAAHPPTLADLQAALADLASARKDGERLETHIQSLYLTKCAHCGHSLPAEAYIWDNKTGKMTGRIYNCTCGSGGEQSATPEDIEQAATWSRTDALFRSRALGRVASTDDIDRPYAEEALNIYLPRAVYALGTLINRLDALTTTDERRRCILALILWACDSCNSLWPHQSERPRPRQLIFPNLFRENNAWMSLEAGVKAWASDEAGVPHTLWPEEPPESGGICIFEGPFRDLARELNEIPLKAVGGAIPRPNQAFWTLSALWAGWLWGREAVGPFKAVLRRRRYDWQWHAEALKSLFTNLTGVITAETPFQALLAEAEPAFITAAILAARTTSFDLKTLDIRAEPEPIHILWQKAISLPHAKLPLDGNYIRKVISETLELNGQPLPYLHLHAMVLSSLAHKGMLPWADDTIAEVEKAIHAALESPDFIDLENRTSPETGTWALKKWGEQRMLKGM